MRFLITIILALTAINSIAQPRTFTAYSEWTKVTIVPKSNAPRKSNLFYRLAFTADFSTTRNGWKAGTKGDYTYRLGQGTYRISKRLPNTRQTAFSYVALPTNIVLNRADTFTIRVDMLADSNFIPDGGLLFGVKDSLNYCQFSVNREGQIAIKRVLNGQPLIDYMAGNYLDPGVAVNPGRNRLMVRRQGERLSFYLNDREVQTSPYAFRGLSGNGVGLTTNANRTSFQKLSVTLGP